MGVLQLVVHPMQGHHREEGEAVLLMKGRRLVEVVAAHPVMAPRQVEGEVVLQRMEEGEAALRELLLVALSGEEEEQMSGLLELGEKMSEEEVVVCKYCLQPVPEVAVEPLAMEPGEEEEQMLLELEEKMSEEGEAAYKHCWQPALEVVVEEYKCCWLREQEEPAVCKD